MDGYISIDYDQYKQIHNILINLVQRFHPEATDWVESQGHGVDECLICGEQLHYTAVEEHGRNHLKEHNLLAFL